MLDGTLERDDSQQDLNFFYHKWLVKKERASDPPVANFYLVSEHGDRGVILTCRRGSSLSRPSIISLLQSSIEENGAYPKIDTSGNGLEEPISMG